eukprot:2662698-Prymnesium_polylepis.1
MVPRSRSVIEISSRATGRFSLDRPSKKKKRRRRTVDRPQEEEEEEEEDPKQGRGCRKPATWSSKPNQYARLAHTYPINADSPSSVRRSRGVLLQPTPSQPHNNDNHAAPRRVPYPKHGAMAAAASGRLAATA